MYTHIYISIGLTPYLCKPSRINTPQTDTHKRLVVLAIGRFPTRPPSALMVAQLEFESHGGCSWREWFAAGSLGDRTQSVTPVRTPVLL